MKKYLFSFALLGTVVFQGLSQSVNMPAVDSKEYEQMKKDGKLPISGVQPINTKSDVNTKIFSPSLDDMKRIAIVHEMPASGGGCGCYQAPDATYTLAMPPVDDGSSSLISIPFTFCLYGTNYTSLYINNNGNISFVLSSPVFSSAPFPSTLYKMVAPFWGDVDTRPAGGGTVKYKITPTAMYVNWTAVGYFDMHIDKLNTFQLIITDGTDPVLPAGNNIAFCYGDMQWTTGDASAGVGGFGGTATGATPATVGVNKGDGISYLQLGRFAEPGAAYDGGYGADDGVDWLDNKSFYFNVCSGNNIPPIASITPPLIGGGGGACDTLKVCGTGDTLLISALFLSPEIGQNTTIVVDLHSTPGASVVSNIPGNTASAQIQIIASPLNAGVNTFTFTATDDGTPPESTVVNVNVFVDTTGLAAFNPSVSGALSFCVGDSSLLSVSPTTFDGYIWNTGSTGTSIEADTAGTYWVTSRKNGCFKTNVVHVHTNPLPTPVIAGYPYTCSGGTTVITVDSLIYSAYHWSTGATTDSVTVGNGTYTVTVTDANGCKGTSPPVTVTGAVPPVITGVTAVCNGDSAVLSTTYPYVSYNWGSSGTADSVIVPAGTYSVTVVDINGCTLTSPPFTVNPFNFTFGVSGVANYCIGQSITLSANAVPTTGASYSWSTSATTASINVNTGGTYTGTVTYPNGCSEDTTVTVPNPYPLATPVIVGPAFTCGTTPATLGVDSVYSSYIWSNASTNSTISALSGTYIVTVTDAHGCKGSDTVTIANVNPTVSITGAHSFCPGDSITLTANPSIPAGASYLWSNTHTNPTTNIYSPGNYNVLVSYTNGCSATDTVSVTQFTAPVANFSSSPSGTASAGVPVSFTDHSTITSGTITNWYWTFGDSSGVGSFVQNPTHTYETDGTYHVTLAVESANGCWDTIRFDYIVASDIRIPNIITPNSGGTSGVNQYFYIKNLEYFPDANLQIFNRWGNKVYESTNYQNNWNGGSQSDGVYYYILSAPTLKDTRYGFFEIIK